MISNSPASVNPLPGPLIRDIVKTVEAAAAGHAGPSHVAFDADGTLWAEDAGESFFQELIDRKLVELPEDPWGHYRNLKAQHPPTAYTWLAQILKGHTLFEVHEWARKCYQRRKLTVFEGIKSLIEYFHTQGIEVWIVTASVQWPVEMALKHHNFPVSGVLGVTTKVVQGVVTDEGVTPVTWREGKAEAIMLKRPGSRPLFCAGNTTGDLALLELSVTPPLALHSQNEDGPLKESELALQKIAIERGWRTHSFQLLSGSAT